MMPILDFVGDYAACNQEIKYEMLKDRVQLRSLQ